MNRKYLLGTFLLYFILVAVYYIGTKDYAIKSAESNIKELLENYKAFRKYASEEQKREIYRLKESGVIDKDYFSPCLLSTSYGVTSINSYYNSARLKNGDRSIDIGFASDNPRDPKNRANPFESDILKKFNSGEITEYKEVIKNGNEDILFYAIPTRKNSNDCLKCHSDPKIAPKELVAQYGDKNGFWERKGIIRAIIKAEYPLKKDLELANKFFFFLSFATFVFFAILLFIVNKFLKELEKRAQYLKEANVELARRYKELKRKDKLLIRQSKLAAMGEMIGIIAHQWKQPLNTLNLMIEDIEDSYLENELTKEYMLGFKQNSYKKLSFMARTIDDFRDFFRPDKDTVSFDLKESVESVIRILKPALVKAHINIEVIGGALTIESVKGELEQVVLNIINNAKDVLVERDVKERRVTIELIETTENIEIKVSDNGGGIAKENLKRVFDSYFSTKGEDGTGIGLYMSKMIVEDSLRGEIKGYNNAYGAVFVVILPKKFPK